jgi:hypothetical protein
LRIVGAIVGLCLLIAAGLLTASDTKYALGFAALVLVAGLFAADPVILPMAAIPATLLVERLGGSSTNLSVSDGVLFLASLCALPLVKRKEDPALRYVLLLCLGYQLATLLTLASNPYKSDFVEWGHRLMLVGGSLIAGWVAGRAGRARQALTIYVLLATALSLWAIEVGVKSHLHSGGLPFGMQKNFVGDMLCFAVLIAHVNPPWAHIEKRMATVAKVLCALGIIAMDSRQAMVSLVIGIGIFTMRSKKVGQKSWLMLLASIPLLVIVYVTIGNELKSTNQFNSVHQRISWFHLSLQLWQTSPLVGVGMRYYYTNHFAAQYLFQPPNGDIESLVETGLIGFAALLLLFGGTLRRMWKLPAVWGTLPFVILLARVVQGQLDILWVGAQGALPWLMVGVSLGAMTHALKEGHFSLEAADSSGENSRGAGRLLLPRRPLRSEGSSKRSLD